MQFGSGLSDDDSAQEGLLDRARLPWGDALAASAQNTFVHNPMTEIFDSIHQFSAQHPDQFTDIKAEYGDDAAPAPTPADAFVDPKTLNSQYGQSLGLTFDAPTRQGAVAIMVRRKQDEIAREASLNRAPGGLAYGVTNLATQLAVSAVDPLNVASAFIPIVPEARAAIWAAKYGKTAARVATGAIEGSVGAAAIEPVNIAASDYLGDDYTMGDSLMNVALGGLLGGGLHAGFGAISDRLSRAAPETRDATLRGAVANVAEGRPVDVEHILDTDPIMRPAGVAADDIKAAADRIDRANQRVQDVQQQISELDVKQQKLDALTKEASDLDTLSKGSSPELISRGVDDITGRRLRDLQDEMAKPAQTTARRAELMRQHDMIAESVAPDLELARGRVQAESQGVAAIRDRAQVELQDHQARLGDHHAELTKALKAAAKAERRFKELSDRAVAPADTIPADGAPPVEGAAPRAATDPVRDAADARQTVAANEAAGDQAASLTLDRARTASLEYGRNREISTAVSPESSANGDRVLKEKLGDDLDTEHAETMAQVDAFEKQGALTPAEAEQARSGADDIKKAKQDGDAARAAARCLLLHP